MKQRVDVSFAAGICLKKQVKYFFITEAVEVKPVLELYRTGLRHLFAFRLLLYRASSGVNKEKK